MTFGRFWIITTGLALTATAVAAGCGNVGAPCTTCAPIEGRYPLEFEAGSIPADCASLGVGLPQGPLDIQRSGSGLAATLEGVPLEGTLFQGNDFSLLGATSGLDGGSTQFSLSGRYTPGPLDGGAGSLSGSFTGNYARGSTQGTRRCAIFRGYTATQGGQP